MKSSLLAVVVAAALFGYFYFYHPTPSTTGQTENSAQATSTSQVTPSSATNFDECIAEGNKPLPDAPDKCLTSDGHIFIKGVVE